MALKTMLKKLISYYTYNINNDNYSWFTDIFIILKDNLEPRYLTEFKDEIAILQLIIDGFKTH